MRIVWLKLGRLGKAVLLSLIAATADGQQVVPETPDLPDRITSSGEAAKPVIEVYKLPDCGCCRAWVRYLQVQGFVVNVTDLADDQARRAVQARFGVPEHLRGCHTAVISNYVVEGHVAAEEIAYLLEHRPKWVGLFVPGMPRGAPGMEGGLAEPYDVVAIDENGHESVFIHHKPASPTDLSP